MKHSQILASLLAAAATVTTVLVSANADLARLTDGPPVVTIHSKGSGAITITPGDFGGVRVPGNPPGVQISRFNVSRQAVGRIVLPRQMGRNRSSAGPRFFTLPGRNFNLPGVRDGAHGIALENSGGDMNVEVPNHVEALLINAGASPVTLDRVGGPFVIVSDSGDVTLRNVTGHGLVRTISGNVDVRGFSGNVHIETAFGRVTMQSSAGLDHAEVVDLRGDVDWTFNGVGAGAYRIFSGQGLVKVTLRPGIGATVDAQSDGGTVTNYFDPSAADIRFLRPHALSLAVGGGGAQITVHSKNGSVVVAPAP
ncbi:MAG TPA: hypothetical protein VN934_01740 [Candidatus Tumulicola sp.]|nr:hypothetical protein [Candidatus Tumulicola sp.]